MYNEIFTWHVFKKDLKYTMPMKHSWNRSANDFKKYTLRHDRTKTFPMLEIIDGALKELDC